MTPDEIRQLMQPYAADSMLTTSELAKLFKTDEDRAAFENVMSVIQKSTDANLATTRLIEQGEAAVKVLVKVAKFVLTA